MCWRRCELGWHNWRVLRCFYRAHQPQDNPLKFDVLTQVGTYFAFLVTSHRIRQIIYYYTLCTSLVRFKFWMNLAGCASVTHATNVRTCTILHVYIVPTFVNMHSLLLKAKLVQSMELMRKSSCYVEVSYMEQNNCSFVANDHMGGFDCKWYACSYDIRRTTIIAQKYVGGGFSLRKTDAIINDQYIVGKCNCCW